MLQILNQVKSIKYKINISNDIIFYILNRIEHFWLYNMFYFILSLTFCTALLLNRKHRQMHHVYNVFLLQFSFTFQEYFKNCKTSKFVVK